MSVLGREIKVSSIMVKDVLTAPPHATASDIMKLLHRYRVGAVTIISDSGKVLGIVTESDVLSAIVEKGEKAFFLPAKDIMKGELIKVQPEFDIDTAYMMMNLNMVRRLPVTDSSGRLEGIITLRDIANTWRKNSALLHRKTISLEDKARRDQLTGVYNKVYAVQTIETLLLNGENFCVMLIDIDKFKQINDLYGHLAGDLAIMETAEFITSRIRSVDMLARYGGDEFVLICPVSDLKSASVAAERLREEVASKKYYFDSREFRITLSIGIAESNEDMKNAREIIRLADNCLYEAKRRGRNNVCVEGFSVKAK